jgi:nickel-dependent lactate racemase
MLNFLVDRLKERSTWLGIITIITAAGIHVTPEQAEAVAVAGAAIAGAVAVFTADTAA